MKHRYFIIMLCLIIAFSGCVEQQEETTTTTSTTTTTLPTTTSTTTTSTTTTSLSYLHIDSADDCMSYENQIERDNCLLSLGIKSRNLSVCMLIERVTAKKLCEITIEGEKTGSATIHGYVMNKTTKIAIKGVKVYAISQTTGEEEAVDTSDSKGFYSMEVPSGETYNITAISGDREYTQTQYARNGWQHELWFMIP